MNCAIVLLGVVFILAAIGLGAILVYVVWTTEREMDMYYRRDK